MDVTDLLGGKRVLVVPPAGDDAAALCAWIFEAAGLEPGFRLAAPAKPFGVALRPASTRRRLVGASAKAAPFVLEGAAPGVQVHGALVTGDPGDAGAAELADLVARVDEDGLVACASSATGARAIAARHPRAAFFAVDGDEDATGAATPTWLGALAPFDAGSGAQPFDLYAGGSYCGRFVVRGEGADVVRVAVGAIAVTAEGFGVDIEKARQALATFEGTR